MSDILNLLGLFLCITGIAYLFFSGPKKDRRFTTGYKDNLIPEKWSKRLIKSFVPLIVGLIAIQIASSLNLENINSSKEKTSENFAIYSKPDKKSKKIITIKEKVNVEIKSDTKYFYEVEVAFDGKKINGYILKEDIK